MIFVDTGAFLGRFLSNDQHHQTATAGWAKLREEEAPCCTSNFVLDETLTFLARRTNYQFASERGRELYSPTEARILRPTHEDELVALDWFEKYADQEVSFTDCVSFVLMKRAGIDTAFSFDRHFQRAGFSLWPGR